MKTLRKLSLSVLMATLLFGMSFPTQNIIAAEQTTQTPIPSETPAYEQPTSTITAEVPSVPEQSEFIASNISPINSKIIVLDPGHCSKHPGARGNGLKEEQVVLDIAKACKNELDQYGDITVYMTRQTNSCCVSLNLGDCLIARNNYAKRLNADFLISMHINWDDKSSKKGANVLAAYKSGYHDNIHIKTQALGKQILSNLHTLGIKNRGLWLRKLKNGRYSNGAKQDYYSIVRNGVIYNIPSIIIEHGYISSPSDCSKYFKTKSQRQTLGSTDANAIISYYGLNKKVITGRFVKDGTSTYYVTQNNKKVTGWVKDNGKWYYFDTDGKMVTGFITLGKNTFYLNPSTGEMSVGWFKVNGSTYLSKGNGAIVKNQTYSDGISTYLFGSTGKQLKKGMHKINGKTYYVNSKTGTIVKNKIVKIKGSKYYFSSTGVRKTGWIKYKGKKYYFSKKTGKLIKRK